MTVFEDLQPEIECLRGVASLLDYLGNSDGQFDDENDAMVSLGGWVKELSDRIEAKLDSSIDSEDPIEDYLMKKKEEIFGSLILYRKTQHEMKEDKDDD